MRTSPLVPDVTEQRAVACQVSGGADGPVLSVADVVCVGLGVPERLVSRSLAGREDERVCQCPHQFPVPVVVVGLAGLPGGRFGGHGVPFLKDGAWRRPLDMDELAAMLAAVVKDRRTIQPW